MKTLMRPMTGAADKRNDTSAAAWFAGGEHVGYDSVAGAVVAAEAAPLRVFLRREGDLAHAVTFLAGYPDGSFGWAKVLPHLPDAAAMPKLFVEYVGQGDSDKPKRYPYSTAERTDLVEALWRSLGVTATTLIAFDFSSLVVLEHLRRRLERRQRGESEGGPEIRGVFIFNGGLFTDGHSHPWFTTPLMRQPGGGIVPWFGRRSFFMFKQLASVMWSKGYRVQDDEVRALYAAMARHDGLFYLSRAAGFVAAHRAQRERLDFGRLYNAYHDQFPFFVGGSDEDPFEHRQVTLSQERLGTSGLAVARLPGGHLTTWEQPEALADLIAGFERRLAKPADA